MMQYALYINIIKQLSEIKSACVLEGDQQGFFLFVSDILLKRSLTAQEHFKR